MLDPDSEQVLIFSRTITGEDPISADKLRVRRDPQDVLSYALFLFHSQFPILWYVAVLPWRRAALIAWNGSPEPLTFDSIGVMRLHHCARPVSLAHRSAAVVHRQSAGKDPASWNSERPEPGWPRADGSY